MLGTLSYMSPEQARDRTVDRRSDIFAFGIVLYEMLAGEHPFQGESGLDTLNAILSKPAARLGVLDSKVTKEAAFDTQRILDKCMAKEPADRYQSIQDLIVDLRTLHRRLESGDMAPAAAPLAGRRTWLYGGALTAVALLMIAVLRLFQPSAPDEAPVGSARPSIAVLYFENVTGDPALDWLRTGLTDMLVTDLSQSPNVETLSTDRLYQILSEANRLDERVTSLDTVQEVAEQGGVDTVILGSFMKSGDDIRINIRIQEARSGKILTSEKVEGVGDSSIFPLVDELTQRIKTNFEIPLAANIEVDQELKNITTSSVEAYRIWVEARKLLQAGNSYAAVPLLEKALELDPDFASALHALSAAHLNLGHLEQAEEYRRRAVEQAARLPARERYFIEGSYYALKEETWARSFEGLEKLLELYPDHNEGRSTLALRYLSAERFEDAARHLEEARRRRYGFVAAYSFLATCYAQLGQFDKGHEVLQGYLARYPERAAAHGVLGQHLTIGGSLDEALEFFRTAELLVPCISNS